MRARLRKEKSPAQKQGKGFQQETCQLSGIPQFRSTALPWTKRCCLQSSYLCMTLFHRVLAALRCTQVYSGSATGLSVWSTRASAANGTCRRAKPEHRSVQQYTHGTYPTSSAETAETEASRDGCGFERDTQGTYIYVEYIYIYDLHIHICIYIYIYIFFFSVPH